MGTWDVDSSGEGEGTLTLLSKELGIYFEDVGELNEFLDAWNDEVLTRCDVLGVLPANEGHVSEYCHLGVSTRAYEVNGDHHWRTCHTGDARMLTGFHQIVNHDTWLEELGGLRILVIHPLAASIARQYEQHVSLLENDRGSGGLFGSRYPNALPRLKELITLAPPETRHLNWKQTLEQFQQLLLPLKDKFDVALLGDVGLGPVLSGYIRTELGRSSIHMGEELHAHFALFGDTHTGSVVSKQNREYRHVINSNWVSPLEYRGEGLGTPRSVLNVKLANTR